MGQGIPLCGSVLRVSQELLLSMVDIKANTTLRYSGSQHEVYGKVNVFSFPSSFFKSSMHGNFGTWCIIHILYILCMSLSVLCVEYMVGCTKILSYQMLVTKS